MVPLFWREAPDGHPHDPLLSRVKVSTHDEQTLLAEQVAQLVTEQLKHWLRMVLRVKPVEQLKHTPVKLEHMLVAQLSGHPGTHRPSTVLKLLSQVTHRPLMSHSSQLLMVQSRQVELTSWKVSMHSTHSLSRLQV